MAQYDEVPITLSGELEEELALFDEEGEATSILVDAEYDADEATDILVEAELEEEEIVLLDEGNEDTDILVELEESVVNMNYKYAQNKPSINEVELIDNKQLEDLYIFPLTNSELEEIIEPSGEYLTASDISDVVRESDISDVVRDDDITDVVREADITDVVREADIADVVREADIADFATETYVDTAVSDLVNSAPATLDTLKELSDALGADPNFSTTMTTALGNKVNTSDMVEMTNAEIDAIMDGTPQSA